ncbi:slightly ste11-like protein [Sporothrix stenoceras]|uniref:Slightly ste11-like protein n=1 Tax=Sporothrix stenoceras TaxID=5173 RepID=A0ABR3ZTF3_9PEZI
MGGPPRTQQDSSDAFTRRFAPAGRNAGSPGPSSRSLAHRPPPLALSPPPPSSLSYGPRGHIHDRDGGPSDDDDRTRDNRSRTPGGTALQLVRKRPAPIDAATPSSDEDEINDDEINGEVNDSKFDEPAAETHELTDTPLEDDFCLCAQAPKIPRPRNVFMLYRQSHQASVVARNPGIANPDISKIIGHMWRTSDNGTKAYWKQRAEEEKKRHRELYPDYRYQPKRAKKKASSGDRPGSASSSGGDICDKCLRPRNAPPSSARSISSSSRQPHPSPSPFGSARGGMQSTPIGDFDMDIDRACTPFPSPVPRQQRQSSPRGQGYSSGEAAGRRPLPPHGRLGNGMIGPRGHPHCQEEDLHTPSDPRQGRYDSPTPFSAQISPYGNGEGSAHAQYNLPCRPSPYNEPHSASIPRYATGPAPSPGSPRMGPPPLPMRHPTRPYAGHYPPHHGYDTLGEPSTPSSGHPARVEGYRGGSGRLPPPTPQDTYGYYPVPGRSGAATPSTAGPLMRQMPTPTAVPLSYSRSGEDPGSINAINRERLLLRALPRHTSGFTDESLRLPPLVTDVSPALQVGRRLSGSDAATDQSSSSARATARSTGAPTGRLVATPAHLQDMHTFASSPTPTMAKHDGDEDRDSQASGIRAMVMSVSYLKKLEVLRRICPPRSLSSRCGPVIAIEGDNAALREAVGRVVERILVSSGKCNVRVWTMASSSSTQEKPTDSGMGSSIHGEDVSMAPSPESGGDCNSRRGSTSNETAQPGSLSFTVSTLGDVMQLTPTWHKISGEIYDHIHYASDHLGLGPLESTAIKVLSRKGKERATGPPSPARSPMEMQLSPTSLSPALKNRGLPSASENSRMSPASANSPASASPSATKTARLLPVALIKTGYSLAISDKCAISVPIDDLYPPVAHWEHMATLWRGTVGPDLVVYADASSAPVTIKGSNGPEPGTVYYADQEGVLVVHVPLSDAARTSVDDGIDIVNQSTQRRLAYDILELVHSRKFNDVGV